jgi:hypothetical protein
VCAAFLTSTGALLQSMSMVRYRQALDDLRYVLTLDRLASRGCLGASDPEAATITANSYLAALLSKIPIQAPANPVFSDAELASIRYKVPSGVSSNHTVVKSIYCGHNSTVLMCIELWSSLTFL